MEVEEESALESYIAQLEALDECEREAGREALNFMRCVGNVCMDPHELAQLGADAGAPDMEEEARLVEEYIAWHEARNAPYVPQLAPEDRITPADRAKELITVRSTVAGGTDMLMMSENMVYVTYFRYSDTKRRCEFVLELLGTALRRCGVELSTSKFAKITLRHLYGPSHLFFASGALLETGTYNPIIARKSLNHTIQLLRELAGYRNIEVGRRTCQNIVAKGTLDFELCLRVLRANYPKCVTYKCNHFVGAIIRLQKRAPQRGDAALDEPDGADGADEETDADDEDDDEYECLEVENNDVIYNSGFAYYEHAPDAEARDNQDLTDPLARLRALDPDSAEARALDEQMAQRRGEELVALDAIAASFGARAGAALGLCRDDDDIDEGDLAQVSKKNVTVIVFEKGRIIIAGCTTTRGARRVAGTVLPMLESARRTRANMDKEKKLEHKETFIGDADDAAVQ